MSSVNSKAPRTNVLGYPRLGENRELKKATESYWNGKVSLAELKATASDVRRHNWLVQKEAGIDLIPSNDFSYYDHVLDMTCLVGNVPPRFKWSRDVDDHVDLDTSFAIARGRSGAHASEMTKWFDTNYHYIVPEFNSGTTFSLSSTKPFDEFSEALESTDVKTKPVLIGPITYLTLGKVHDSEQPDFDRFSLLDKLLPVYVQVLQKLALLGAEWVQMDEPAFALDLSLAQRSAFTSAYAVLTNAAPSLKLLVASYFGGLHDNRHDFLSLPVAALHVDVTRAPPQELDVILKEFPKSTALSLGVVDGRNIWRTDYDVVRPILDKAVAALGANRVIVGTSCSMLHVPFTLRNESKLDEEFKGWLAFAEEKLLEVATLGDTLTGKASPEVLAINRDAIASRRASDRVHRPEVVARLEKVIPADMERSAAYFPVRQTAQRARLSLPLLPTTTIGSFPQTFEVRRARANFKKGDMSKVEYEKFLEAETAAAVRFQEEIGIDMLVHGEFERNDMVEYFGEQLEGNAFTENGWVQSYGSRYVKPPIIFGDVSRPAPMTVRWSSFAQSLTKRPMKGMLTGPMTMLQWSFVRDDQPRKDTAFQIALVLRDEVIDLENAGIAAIQIDEPALREGLPLRRHLWSEYLDWAVKAFRLSSAGVRNDTQIHSHMCYSEFNDIIDSIAALDADVITIECSRSSMELLQAFVDFKYPNEIGPGIYDIHSPCVPSVMDITNLLLKALEVIPADSLWVNPDCGLKTRNWMEVKQALANMVESAHTLRNNLPNNTVN